MQIEMDPVLAKVVLTENSTGPVLLYLQPFRSQRDIPMVGVGNDLDGTGPDPLGVVNGWGPEYAPGIGI